jgi:aminoacrylate hydrolase
MPDLPIQSGLLHYRRDGAGDPVIFVSGLGGNASFWGAQVRAFSDRYSVVTFDHRGIGGSSGPPPYSVAQWSDDLLRLADHLRLDRFHLVGHSTGGIISQVFAAAHPDRVRTLALGGTWLSPDRRFRELFALRASVLAALGNGAYRTLGALVASPDAWEETASVAPQPDAPAEIVTARIDALLAYEGAAHVALIRAPTLVLAAADDYLVPAYLSRQLADAMAGSRSTIFEDGGHFFPQTRAPLYNEALSRFWAEASGR